MPLEVIGVGFGRTGTASLQKALDILYQEDGKRCYHFVSIITRPDHATTWIDILSGKRDRSTINWEDELFGPENFVATVDHPCVEFYKELMQQYPNAKLILTTHPGGREGWYESKLGHQLLGDCLTRWPLKPVAGLAAWVLLRIIVPMQQKEKQNIISLGQIKRLVELTEWNVWGERGVHDADNALGRYNEWYANVRESVPKEKLLEYNVTMGWEPLCEFLGKSVPKNVAFPRETSHSTKEIKRTVARIETWSWIVFGILGVISFNKDSKYITCLIWLIYIKIQAPSIPKQLKL